MGHRAGVGMWLKEWRKRYFVLKGNKLHFCKAPGVCLRRARVCPVCCWHRAAATAARVRGYDGYAV